MWTDRHRPYYSLVRSEDEKHKKKLAPTTVAATTQTNISSHTDGGAALQNTNAFSSTNNNGTFATAGTTTMASERYDGSKTNNNNNNRSSSNSGESDGKVLDPVKALRLARTAIKDTREVTCCRKAITQLHPNFLFFESLEVLILNKNHLRSAKNLIPSSARDANGGDTKSSTALCGPRGCIRLRQLHLSDNRISDLQDTDIPRLGTLEQLYLANNRLTNLMLVVRILKNRLPSLVYLDLRGNPIAEEYGYRPFVVNSLPNLKVLDRLAITATERREAKEHCAALQLQQQQQQPAVAEAIAMHSPRPPIKTEVAFNSTYRPQEAPEAPRQGLWSKSRCVVMMEQRHDNYLEDAEQQKEAAAQAEADRINLMKNTRTAFHAVWALSRAPLPLAEQKQREWRQSEAEAAAGGAASVADGAASEAPNLSTTTNSTNRAPQRRALHTSGNNGSSAILSAASVGDSATANNAELTATTVKIPRDVLETALPDSTSNEDPDNASVMYDALLHKRDVVAEKTVKGNSSWAAASTPSAVRLRDMSTAIQTTTDMLQIGANGLMSSSLGGTETGVALTVSSPKRTRGAKAVVSVRRRNSRSAVQSAPPTSSSAAAAAAATINVSTAQLRRVADNTHAFIPSPWEDPSGAGSCGATSAIATPEALRLSQLEAQGHALQLVKLLLLPHECVSLETYFGAGEVLQVLGIDQARKMSLPPAGAATTGQQQQQQQRHRPGTNANSGRKGRQSAATQAVTAGLLQDAALLHLMTTSQLGPASLLPMHATAAAAQQGLSSATSSAATPPPQQQQQQQSLVVLPGLVGPYQLGSLGDFMGRLDSQSGAWSVPMQPLLNAIAARHQVNLATSAPRADAVKSSGTADSARDADTSKRSDSPGLSSRRGGKREEKEDRKLRTPASRGASTGTGGGSGGRRRQGGRGAAEDQPAVTAASIAAAAAARPKSWLTINNIAGALLCYIPFVESRLAYFKSKCTQCATAARGSNGSGGADEAMVWFSRAQGAQQHLEALQKAGPSPVDGQGALVDFSFLSARSVRPIGTAFGELL